MTRAARTALWSAVLACLLAACGASPEPVGPRGIDELTIPTPTPDPADFSGRTANVWFPLEPGTVWRYRRYTPTGHAMVLAGVLAHRRHIDGIETTAIRWQTRAKGRSRTLMVRWYAVDRRGDVWWLGQRVVGRPHLDSLATRSWLAGRHGAEAGLVLSATPRVGDGYVNASQPQVVARRSTVQSIDGTVATGRRTYHHAVVTQDLSSLAPLHTVQTFYARGVGLVAQQDTVADSTSLVLFGVRRPPTR